MKCQDPVCKKKARHKITGTMELCDAHAKFYRHNFKLTLMKKSKA